MSDNPYQVIKDNIGCLRHLEFEGIPDYRLGMDSMVVMTDEEICWTTNKNEFWIKVLECQDSQPLETLIDMKAKEILFMAGNPPQFTVKGTASFYNPFENFSSTQYPFLFWSYIERTTSTSISIRNNHKISIKIGEKVWHYVDSLTSRFDLIDFD